MLFSFVTDIMKKCTTVNANFFTLTSSKLSTFVVHEVKNIYCIQLRSCRHVQLLDFNHTDPWQASQGQFTSNSANPMLHAQSYNDM